MRGMITLSQLCSQLTRSVTRRGYLTVNGGYWNQSTDLAVSCKQVRLKQPLIHSDVTTGPPVSTLTNLISKLTVQDELLAIKNDGIVYKLPTYEHNQLYKRSILDPSSVQKIIDLPALKSMVNEKLTPSLIQKVPVDDPNPLQQVIDQGSPPSVKYTMPYLVRIRHKKMKKHKLRKFRKRMIFVHRKLESMKKKRREKAIVAFENSKRAYAESFDPEQYVAEKLQAAKRGGWTIDVLERSRTLPNSSAK